MTPAVGLGDEGTAQVFRALDAWESCTPRERELGRRFYPEAAGWCEELAREHGRSPELVAAVVAALSPNNSWLNNRRSAEALLRGDDSEVRSYGRDHLKALRLLAGADPWEVLHPDRAPKTHAFWQLLAGGCPNLNVCVDGHMANLLRGERRPLKRVHLSLPQFREMRTSLLVAATMVGESASTLQAGLWVAWRAGLGWGQGRVA